MIRTDHLLSTASRIACGVLLIPTLMSCGASSGARGSQVVATVNGHEITVTQLNHALESAGVREVSATTRQRAIESLATEELLVQAALQNDIDRDAGFVQALEQSRRQLLSQFFAERMIYPKTLISATEIADYYNKQPLLFAQRRRFRLTTFQAAAADVTPAVSAELEAVNSVEKVRDVLDAHGIKYTTERASISPEQLPADELETYSKAAVGDLFINPRGDGSVLLMSVAAIEEDVPMTLERARPLIEEYLHNTRNQTAAADYVARIRASAKIVYAQPAEVDPPPDIAITRTTTEKTSPLATVSLAQ
jgi:EpsD family peptidyl-prolyl cis-trans isomerase